MIPVLLRLENFMSYAELELDFTGLHLAVLTGPNGAGKSTILDALTYALWEKARAVPEQLIRLGQKEMWVELSFELEGQEYRVFRRRTRKTGVGSQLEFHQREGDAWVPLTGTTTRETQARILQTVRMDYDTFINSAYLRQGRADEFTTKTPQERKAVLAEILGLGTYDALASRARDRWRQTQSRADQLESEQLELRAELEGRGPLVGRLAARRESLDELNIRLAEVEEAHDRLAEEGRALTAAQARREGLARELGEAESASARLGAAIAEAHAQVAEAADAVARREAIEGAYADWREWTEREQHLRTDAEAYQAYERELAARERSFHDASHQVELSLQALDADLAALERDVESYAGLIKDRERIEKAQAVLVAAREAETAHMEKAQLARALEARELELSRRAQQAQLQAEAAGRDLAARLARAKQAAAEAEELADAVDASEKRLATLEIKAVEADRAKEKGFQLRARNDELKRAIERAHTAAIAKMARLSELTPATFHVAHPEQAFLPLEGGGEPRRRRGGGERTGDGYHAGPPVTPTLPSPLQGEDAYSAHCPMCAHDLDEAGLARVASQLEAEAQGFEDEATRLDHDLAEVEEKLAESRAKYASLAKQIKARDAEQIHLGELKARLAVAEAAREEAERLESDLAATQSPVLPTDLVEGLEAVRAELAALGYDPAELSVLQARISDNRWADAKAWQLEQAITALKKLDDRRAPLLTRRASLEAAWQEEQATHQARVAEIESAMAALGHDPAGHSEAQARLQALADAPTEWAALQQHLLELATAQGQMARLEAERAAIVLTTARLTTEQAELEGRLARFEAWQREAGTIEATLAELRAEERRRHAELGRLDAELQRLDEAAVRLTERESEWKTAVSDAQTYKELAAAFGKNGIQAVLIENAIPELEEDANRLLARMTDNRMHVRLATQKEKKTGGVGETLEIYISDEVGTRPYELYSGGEAFRVNFALRLALSRLLARRAGAKLQTLIIDEGFGTQDERGREKLVEAINAVSEEFARILVITHIRELKDAFNTQIEVVKRGGVSEVRAIA